MKSAWDKGMIEDNSKLKDKGRLMDSGRLMDKASLSIIEGLRINKRSGIMGGLNINEGQRNGGT